MFAFQHYKGPLLMPAAGNLFVGWHYLGVMWQLTDINHHLLYMLFIKLYFYRWKTDRYAQPF